MTGPALLPLLDRLDGVSVLLLGDLMLDRYLWGDVSRISPEAPVPVLRVIREESRLGGAGSVIANLAALGAKVHAAGILGADAPGDRLMALLQEIGVDTHGIVRTHETHTTQKTRVIARRQQLMRLDRDAESVPAAALTQLRERCLAALDHVSGILISDYGRGVLDGDLCRELANVARERGLPVLVDPHRNAPFERYTGATTLTPNRAETAKVVGFPLDDTASMAKAARQLIDRFELDWVALTLDKDGVFLLRKGESTGQRFPARARSVFDVTGAGDMILSVLGLAVSAGVDTESAIRLANVAAGWEVEHVGALPLSRDEFAVELSSDSPPELRRKVMDSFEAAAERVRRARAAGKEIVFTNGCFDLLHAGHVTFIQGCRAKGDYLIVGLNTDESITALKGEGRPVLPLQARATVLAGLEAVDIVVPFAESTPIRLINALRPDILCKGEDYLNKVVVGREIVEGYGGRVELVELVPGVSTTTIIARISENEDRP